MTANKLPYPCPECKRHSTVARTVSKDNLRLRYCQTCDRKFWNTLLEDGSEFFNAWHVPEMTRKTLEFDFSLRNYEMLRDWLLAGQREEPHELDEAIIDTLENARQRAGVVLT